MFDEIKTKISKVANFLIKREASNTEKPADAVKMNMKGTPAMDIELAPGQELRLCSKRFYLSGQGDDVNRGKGEFLCRTTRSSDIEPERKRYFRVRPASETLQSGKATLG